MVLDAFSTEKVVMTCSVQSISGFCLARIFHRGRGLAVSQWVVSLGETATAKAYGPWRGVNPKMAAQWLADTRVGAASNLETQEKIITLCFYGALLRKQADPVKYAG